MVPTVREILALPVVAAGLPDLIGGRPGLDTPVRWVHISESSDPTGLLQGGELVLTTGLPLVGEAAAAAAYLRVLAEHAVAGLVIELGTHLAEVPPHLADAADAAGLPVAALAKPIRFIDVTQQVHALIVADRYNEVEFARTTHEVFTSLNIARASTTDIVTQAAQILHAPLVLEDPNRYVLAFSTAGQPASRLLDQWSERSRRHEANAEASEWLDVGVGLGPERWARLVLPETAEDPSRAMMVLERAAQSLELHRMIQQNRDTLIGQAHGGLLEDLCSGRVTDETEALARATSLGLVQHAQYVPLVVYSARGSYVDAMSKGELDRGLLSTVRRAITGSGHAAIVSLPREGTVTAVFACEEPEAALAAIHRSLQDHLRPEIAEHWMAGTARPSSSLLRAARGLDEADHVAEVGLSLAEPRRLLRSTDIRIRGLLALLREDHRVRAFAERELGAILDHDSRVRDPLLPLLRAYLESDGSKTRTAQLTGLSRPTLYSRLHAIERLLGTSLETAESRTSLHVALMISETRRL